MRKWTLFSDFWDSIWAEAGVEWIAAHAVEHSFAHNYVGQGPYEGRLKKGDTVLLINALDTHNVRLTLFARGGKAFGIVECAVGKEGWIVKRMTVRSSIYRICADLCRRAEVECVADAALHSLELPK
jgi:hypothetical protein